MDIGAGIAGIDLVLSNYLNLDEIILVDKTMHDSKVHYLHQETGSFYNSLVSAKDLLIRGGVEPDRIQTVTAPNDGVIPCPAESVDLVISTISWGFHYPVPFYLESVYKILTDEGVLIIDVRKPSIGLEELRSYFNVDIISKGEKSVRAIARKRRY